MLSNIGTGELPSHVTTNKEEFLSNNPLTLQFQVEERPGEARGQPIRVVFDTGAGVCLWTQQTILRGDLNCWIDCKATKTLEGIGGSMGSTPFVVRLPGNTKTKDNRWKDFLACSSIVPTIIPDLGLKNT